ncbi:hypothetical protein FBUS_10654 [Fasciolopsis buskii]|uniref:EF-hand domain-containing protein n=1 Tax=Fasciolopsis buskii TaxID=27845 RepID=A0A8E0RQT9_9TREM|nr:hypothetical protein FBUS_10654 [Fasciolopsis buski]
MHFSVAQIRDVFEQLDADKSGRLSVKEIKQALDMMDACYTETEIAEFVADHDQDGDGELDLEETIQWFTRFMKKSEKK